MPFFTATQAEEVLISNDVLLCHLLSAVGWIAFLDLVKFKSPQLSGNRIAVIAASPMALGLSFFSPLPPFFFSNFFFFIVC